MTDPSAAEQDVPPPKPPRPSATQRQLEADELYARHKDLKEALEKQRLELEEKKKRLGGVTGGGYQPGGMRPGTPDKKNKGFNFKK